MKYRKDKTAEISLPMGGIGAGGIGLAGNGELRDWEIFNAPNKFSRNGLTHFAVRSEYRGKVEDFRILHGDVPMPYSGESNAKSGSFTGFGWGPYEETLCSWPHFRNHEFEGKFPFGRVTFSGEKFPAQVAMTGWSVLVPGDSRNSSLPAAFIEVELMADKTRDFTVVGVLENPWYNDTRYNKVEGNQLTTYQGEDGSEVTLSLLNWDGIMSYQTDSAHNVHSSWRDHQEKYLRDMLAGGLFQEYQAKEKHANNGHIFGLLAAHFHLKAGEHKKVCFAITWHVPNCSASWAPWDNDLAKEAGVSTSWLPWYATQWENSRISGKYAGEQYETLREQTTQFVDALNQSTLLNAAMDGISANLSVLKSPTCLRLQDGTFWGWEGVGIDWGSCPGSCAHVWNYQQALPYLFPDLERSMLESHLKFGVDEFGGHHFRIKLPLGLKARPQDFRPCADGQFGEIMKFYREWQIGGDDEFLKRYWPILKKMLEYAWSPNNPDRWDPDKTGVLRGRQHHTLDMELFGPHIWLTAHYLGALKAMAIMADYLHEPEYADECRKIYKRGRHYVETSGMFNGEYFVQQMDLTNHAELEKYPDTDQYWDEENSQMRYQIGEGCSIDSHLAQWFANLWGLGELYSPEMNRSTLKAIYKYNFKPSMRDAINLWRVYALNDEGGTMICTWPRKRPAVPLTYHSEMMTGFEWAFGAHLIASGMVKEGEKVIAAIRARFNGQNRNPWNEIECGSNYARSMASFGVLASYSGFVCRSEKCSLQGDGAAKAYVLRFNPVKNMTAFWSIGTAWGTFEKKKDAVVFKVLHGALCLKALELPFLEQGGQQFETPLMLAEGAEIKL